MPTFRTILHPTDFSEQAGHAFRLACRLARDHGSRLVVLHVVPAPVSVMGGTVALPPLPEEYDLSGPEEALRALRTDVPGVAVEHVLRTGEAAAEVLRVARELPCDLIVLGTHGRRGLGRLLLGSVAEEVARKAPCPVLTLKEPPPAGHEPAAESRQAVGV